MPYSTRNSWNHQDLRPAWAGFRPAGAAAAQVAGPSRGSEEPSNGQFLGSQGGRRVADVIVEPVDTRAGQKRFLRLPWRIYADDPCWMPPLLHSQEELLGFRPHPFYDK